MDNKIFSGAFGECCSDLKDAITQPPNSFYIISENNVLYNVVGYMETEEGTAWYDMAIIYCPFCGIQLQSPEKIAQASK